MKTGEAFIVFAVDPFLFSFWGEIVGLRFNLPVVFFKKVSDNFMIVIVCSNMKDAGVLVVDDLIDSRAKLLEKLLGFLMIETLDSLKKLLFFGACHYIICCRRKGFEPQQCLE